MKKSILFATSFLAAIILFAACDKKGGNGGEPDSADMVGSIEGYYNVYDARKTNGKIIITGIENKKVKFELKDYAIYISEATEGKDGVTFEDVEVPINLTAEFDVTGELDAVEIDWKGDFTSDDGTTYAGEVKGSINKRAVSSKSASVNKDEEQELELDVKFTIDDIEYNASFINELDLLEDIKGTYNVFDALNQDVTATVTIEGIKNVVNRGELTLDYDGTIYVAEVDFTGKKGDVAINSEPMFVVNKGKADEKLYQGSVVGTINEVNGKQIVSLHIKITFGMSPLDPAPMDIMFVNDESARVSEFIASIKGMYKVDDASQSTNVIIEPYKGNTVKIRFGYTIPGKNYDHRLLFVGYVDFSGEIGNATVNDNKVQLTVSEGDYAGVYENCLIKGSIVTVGGKTTVNFEFKVNLGGTEEIHTTLVTPVDFNVVSVSSNGVSLKETTTVITITLEDDIPGFTKNNISIKGNDGTTMVSFVTVEESATLISKGGGVYELPVLVTYDGTVTVHLNKPGYVFTPIYRSVKVNKKDISIIIGEIAGTYPVKGTVELDEVDATILIEAIAGNDNKDKIKFSFTYDDKTYVVSSLTVAENVDGTLTINNDKVEFVEGINNNHQGKVVGTITDAGALNLAIKVGTVIDTTFTGNAQ